MEIVRRPIDKRKRRGAIRGAFILTVLIVVVGLTSWRRPVIMPFASSVDAFKVEPEDVYRGTHPVPSNGAWPPPGGVIMDNCLVIDGPKHFGTGFAHRLNFTLLNPLAFTRNVTHCEMVPGFIFRIWQGKRSQDVVLCFHCRQVETITRDAQGHQTAKAFGGIGTGFAALVKEAFPKDPFFTTRHL